MKLSPWLFRLLLGRRLPRTRGTLTVPGLRAGLRIRRDRWGIPAIDAETEADGAFGLGFCHGQDRTFQLELLLRATRGTLAELFGPAVLPIDQLSRRIGFHHSARQQWTALDSEVRGLLEAYARGVTAGAAFGLPRRPHEFALLFSRPTPWTPEDCLGVAKLISFTLSSNWDAELARFLVLTSDGPEALADLDPAYPDWLPLTTRPGQAAGPALDRLAADLELFATLFPAGGASNNWAVSAARTATGRPLLANDPHLDARTPSHWYLARVWTPQGAVAGASFVGGPFFPAGHNGHAAWGITAGLIDNTDLFREQVGPDGGSVRQGDDFLPCPVREEVIPVRGSAPVTEKVLLTPRGPVISPALSGVEEALSLRATWLDPLPVRGLFRAQKARSFQEFRRELEQWPFGSANMVYADASGTIGWQMAGRAPRRRKGWGTLPLAGWDPEAGWEKDPVPFADLPHLADPAEGFVATANTRPQPEGTGPFLSTDWIDGYRLAAIQQALAARRDWDVSATLALQQSQQSLVWPEVRAAILALPDNDPDVRRALELLRGWDGRLGVESPAAAVYELFMAEMALRVAQARAPRSSAWVVGQGFSLLTDHNFFCFRRAGHLSRLLRSRPAGWFERPWPDEMADALADVVGRLRETHGDDTSRWAWGRVRTLVLRHPLGRSPSLAPVFNRGPVPCGGDTDTINQASVLPLKPTEPCNNIASLRLVVDVGAWLNSRFVLPGGQSGNPLSQHYDDLFPLWQRGEGVPIPWTEEEVRQATRDTLLLNPEPARRREE